MRRPSLPPLPTAIAVRAAAEFEPDASRDQAEWAAAQRVCFDLGHRNTGPREPGRRTCVRILWTPANLYLRFDCRYRTLTLFPRETAEADGRREHLWERDVAEAFIQSDPGQPHVYREFEVSPNGLWLDLAIGGHDPGWRSHALHSIWLSRLRRLWRAELRIPMAAVGAGRPPQRGDRWRLNLFRQEGLPKDSFEWSASGAPTFHIPERFGYLRFH